MMKFLSDNLAIATLLLVTLLVLILLGLIINAALRGTAQGGAAHADSKLRTLGAESLRQSFRSAVELIESNLAARHERYKLSWTLLLNDSAQRPLPLAQSGLPSALSADSTLSAAAQGIDWHFFDSGVIVQLQAGHLGSPDPDSASSNGVWDDFLGLCRSYRPQRPFDSIVLAVPCTALLQTDPQGQLDLMARAKAIHHRLWLAQNRLALRFPIYLVVSECEALPGFANFGSALPEALRRSMLGWSSPYELVAPFRTQWADSAMDDIVRAASDRCAELSALEPPGADSSAYLMLPGELERLRGGLKLFCEELMRPSAYHEPFLLRGMYLTGDSGDAAALLAAMPAPPTGALAAPSLAAPGPGEPAVAATAEAMPVFMRDIFERKVFAEAGLVQSSSQRMRRPAASRVASWVVLALPVLWAAALVVSTVRLHQLGGDLVGYLNALNSDTRRSLQTARAGIDDPQRSQRRATDALLNIEQLGSARFNSVFMPGSWPLFDDLHQRVVGRLEQGFADNAFDPLRRAAFSRLGQLTGVPIEPVSGALIGGAQCTMPAGWSEQVAAQTGSALNVDDLPQFGATLGYLARLDEIDRVIGAMLRLKHAEAGPASGADLALVVRVLLGAELNGAPARTAALFRAVAQREPSLALEPMQAAARCSLRRASTALYQRLFDDNDLLRSERMVAASSAALFAGAQPGAGLAGQLPAWHALRDALNLQQNQIAGGKGGWMIQSSVNLGAAHESMIDRIGANSLLGKSAVQETRRRVADGFGRFVVARDAALSAPSPIDGMADNLVWSGSAWAFSPPRQALHASVAALVAQPWMNAGGPAQLPVLARGATVSWNKALLEQAIGLAEARKRFQAGPFMALPARLQQPAAALADLALAASAQRLLMQALSVAPVELPSGASDAERASVLRVRAWLLEIGAGDVSAELDAVLAADALSRLQRLDDIFRGAEVFVPRERAFEAWNGEKGVLLDAFGNGNAAVLAAYVAQQLEFVDTAASQAEGVLAQMTSFAPGHPLVARWQAIVADLRRYRLKSPASSLMALEQFIVSGSADIDLGNCTARLSSRGGQRGADVFAERLLNLQAGLLVRCRELAAGRYREEWERFAGLYNRDLARRAPFDARPGGDALPADRDAVGEAMNQFDRARAASALAEREPGVAGASAAVREAGEQLRRMREVLAPLYPVEPGQVGGLDVTVQFRPAGVADAGANQIIDWRLAIGAGTLRLGDAPRALRWEPGMPVLLSLRLARDGSGQPQAEPGHLNMSVTERTVNYRFGDPWALFSFIGAYRDSEVADGDQRGPLLRFDFPVLHTGAGVNVVPLAARTRVFLRLSVSAPGKRTPLAWPTVFLSHVPRWQDAAPTSSAALLTNQLEANAK
ncbi:type VI secretion system protein [Massilia pseudoviolaceinigra]|uniref:type VI secretion system protein n=1 Tax=Massilia pseudoviolaceinigra TaxID=3057165 RepID=UPI002796922B|nr:type VI secretion system protein [Massilia sp. CCM 9206]MDQ1919163.1 type VI secretion system protein [Massilia sp. CCM 9206]